MGLFLSAAGSGMAIGLLWGGRSGLLPPLKPEVKCGRFPLLSPGRRLLGRTRHRRVSLGSARCWFGEGRLRSAGGERAVGTAVPRPARPGAEERSLGRWEAARSGEPRLIEPFWRGWEAGGERSSAERRLAGSHAAGRFPRRRGDFISPSRTPPEAVGWALCPRLRGRSRGAGRCRSAARCHGTALLRSAAGAAAVSERHVPCFECFSLLSSGRRADG